MVNDLDAEGRACTTHPPTFISAPEKPLTLGRISFFRTMLTLIRCRNSQKSNLALQNSTWVSLITFHFAELIVISSIILTSVALFEWQAYQTLLSGGSEQFQLSIFNVLEKWLDTPTNSPLFEIPLFVSIVLPLAALLASWVFLSNVHRAGPVFSSFKRSYLSVLACSGILNFCFALALTITTTVNLTNFGNRIELRIICEIAMFLAVCFLILFFLTRLDRTTQLAGRLLEPIAPIAPRCEGCGYDLTHLPGGGVCTECGLSWDGWKPWVMDCSGLVETMIQCKCKDHLQNPFALQGGILHSWLRVLRYG
jgi:hypothetical protein